MDKSVIKELIKVSLEENNGQTREELAYSIGADGHQNRVTSAVLELIRGGELREEGLRLNKSLSPASIVWLCN